MKTLCFSSLFSLLVFCNVANAWYTRYPPPTPKPGTKSTPPTDDLLGLFDEMLGVMINGNDDNETAVAPTPTVPEKPRINWTTEKKTLETVTPTAATTTKNTEKPGTEKPQYSTEKSRINLTTEKKGLGTPTTPMAKLTTENPKIVTSTSAPEMFNISLTTDNEGLENATTKSKIVIEKPEEKTRYNAHCDLIQTFIIHHKLQNSNAWSVEFTLKIAPHQVEPKQTSASHYVVRYKPIYDGKSSNIGETQFLVVPYQANKTSIAIENLRPGEYSFQICVSTANFKPSLFDNEQFSWNEKAPVTYLFLHLYPKAQVEESKEEEIGIAW